MGWWKIEYLKKNSEGVEIELSDEDLDYIAQKINEGYTEGKVVDDDGDDEGGKPIDAEEQIADSECV